MRYLVLAVMLLYPLTVVAAGPTSTDLDEQQAEQYHDLTKELRCLVCQNESIAESDADLAADLRRLVAKQVADGKNDDQIKSYMVERYGDWVLYDPPFKWSTWLLWISPFIVLLMGLVAAFAVMRGSRRASTQTTTANRSDDPDDERIARILAEADQPGSQTRDEDESR